MSSTDDFRYIGWFLAGRLVLFCLTVFGIALDDLCVNGWITRSCRCCGLIGALVSSSYKWGSFTFGLIRSHTR
ncbi:hypothetical protein V1517DRAFT_320877 [Lipomyces orientalis]|uniref:Uncharacterized protein n=1 Tax=Lipomyces orientalis TaxID=1233043 RepID=A0ACC3TQ94_9ASCO